MMNTRRTGNSLLIGAIAALLVGGCSSATQTTVATGSDSTAESAAVNVLADSVLAKLRRSYASTPMLSLTGDMKISGVGATVWFDALVRGRDSLKVSLVGPFGIPVGALSATRSSFLFFNVQEGEAVEGIPDRETFGKLMQLDLEYDEMTAMLRGELPRIPAAGEYSAEERDGVLYYTVPTALGEEIFTVDIDDLTVTSYRRTLDGADEPFEEIAIAYRDFHPLGGRQFPKKASVSIAGGERKITVTVDRMRDSIDESRSCAIDVPAGVERKRL